MREKAFKNLLFSTICIMALATIAGCDKENSGSGSHGSGTSAHYVDLGLPSGTIWKSDNEQGYYDFNSAVETFGESLPTYEQLEELIDNCTWTWNEKKKRLRR